MYLHTYTRENDGRVCAADGTWTKVPWPLMPKPRGTVACGSLWDRMQDWGLLCSEGNIRHSAQGCLLGLHGLGMWLFLQLFHLGGIVVPKH